MYASVISKPLPPIPCEPEAALTPDPSHSTPTPYEESMVPSEPKAELPTWTVEYHSEAKQVLELHLANVI